MAALNGGAEEALTTYLSSMSPGFALLVDGPWGSGKTHFVRHVCSKHFATDDYRYVSLNGVTDSMSFRRALLKDDTGSRLASATTTLAKALGETLKIESLGGMAERAIEQVLISNIPDILVFDDLERTKIDSIELLGLLNDFVEQGNKKIVLIADSEKHPDKENFIVRKEKIVGRTLLVEPAFDEAFTSFFARIPEGRAKDYIIDRRQDVFLVFSNAGYKNLRLLRNAVIDLAMILEKVNADYFVAKEAMARFSRTYIALHMALGKADISKIDLESRARWEVFRPEKSDDASPLSSLYKRHQGADIVALGGSTMSVELGLYLLSFGHLEASRLNNYLLETNQFGLASEENPLWKRLVLWGHSGWDGLDELVGEGLAYLQAANPIDPGQFLHISDTLLRIAQLGGIGLSVQQLKKLILRRISWLSRRNLIPEAVLGIGMGWGKRGGTFSYGGYACEPDVDFLEVIGEMEKAQIAAFNKTEGDRTRELVSIFSRDVSEFRTLFEGSYDRITYFRVPIMHRVKLKSFSKAVVGHLLAGRTDELGDLFELLAERHSTSKVWNAEKAWFQELRLSLERLASARSKPSRAHLNWFFKFHWKFQPPYLA